MMHVNRDGRAGPSRRLRHGRATTPLSIGFGAPRVVVGNVMESRSVSDTR
jgi:hypothetical protein